MAQQKLEDSEWSSDINKPKFNELRSQWMRAWLLGAISHPQISTYAEQFRGKLAENDYALYEKLLVWFQAEKTKPNPLILATSKDMRTATSMAWPSDLTLWFQVIKFILNDISSLPEFLYQQITDVFSVFQNVTLNADFSLELSSEILQVALDWLSEIEGLEGSASIHNWKLIDDTSEFRNSLRSLLITSTISNPKFIEAYLKNLLALNEIPNDIFRYIIQFSGFIAQKHPELLVELCLKNLKAELPIDKHIKECEEEKLHLEYWESLENIPAEERTEKQKDLIKNKYLFFSQTPNIRVNDRDWKKLALRDESYFYPSSYSTEPFYSLLKNTPEYGLNLIKDLSNHAITAWRQLHELSDEKLTPIPITLEFPWGSQTFWGNEKEYIWSRPYWVNNTLSSAFMTLEKWCFEQLEANADLNKLIQRITKDHESVAILSVVSVLALEKQCISKTLLPLVTNQKILDLDYYRFTQDIRGASTPLISYQGKNLTHKTEINEIKEIYKKPSYKSFLANLIPGFMLSEFEDLLKHELNNLSNNLSYNYTEHIGNHIITENLLERCKYYSGYTDRTTYVVEPIKGTDKIAISHRSPSLDTPESIEAFEEVRRFENYITLTMWAENSLEKNTLDANVDLPKAIEFIKSQYGLDIDIFEDNCDGWSDETTRKRMEQNAVAAVATMVLCFRKGLADTDLEWAREIISKILDLPFNSYECSTPEAQLVFHPKKFVSKALASEIKNGTYNGDTRLQLLFIIASPVNEVSISALNACFLLYDVDKKLAYSAMFLAISICHDYLKHRIYNSEDDSDLAEELYSLEYTVHEYFQSDDLIIKLPEYKSPWIELKEVKYRPSSNYHLNKFFDAIKWERSDEQWDTTFLSHVLKQLPTKELLHSEFKEELLNFIENLINWTIELIEPSWSEQYSHEDNHSSLYEFSDALCNVISTICEVLPFNETYSRFVEPILLLKSEECWQLIEPLVRYCSCKLYDESIVSEDVIKILERCLDRFLQIEELKNDCYRIGKFDVFKNNTLKSLMFTRITQFDSAKRFANGNWSEISLILPIIDRLVREAGWVSVVMKNFVQLCDHAKNDYPAEVFADQVLTVISKPKLVGWQGSTLYSRISELVQFFAERDNPLDLETGQKLLRIIDWLIDQGDRRSASLQQSELFRSIKVN